MKDGMLHIVEKLRKKEFKNGKESEELCSKLKVMNKQRWCSARFLENSFHKENPTFRRL